MLALLQRTIARERLMRAVSPLLGPLNPFVSEYRDDFTDRAVIEDCELGGRKMRKGQLLGIALTAANRDPAQFGDPDRLDIGRDPNPHLALSHGEHFCLGAQLARLEGEIAIGALLRRFPNFRGPENPPQWRRSMVLRGPASLPLQLQI